MNPKRSIKISERLSFSFGLLFVLLLIIMPLTAGTYAYNQGISDYTEYSTDTLKHISLMLKNNYSASSGIEEFTRYAESLRSEFELPVHRLFRNFIRQFSDKAYCTGSTA